MNIVLQIVILEASMRSMALFVGNVAALKFAATLPYHHHAATDDVSI